MLRPERMSRVSVTGSKGVMNDVVETAHDLGLLHVTDYDGSWDGFDPGDPMAGADAAAERLVTVRSLKSILGVTGEEVGATQVITDDAIESELEEIRQEVNALDDERDELRDELRDVDERIDAMEPFVELGIDLDLLRGYDSLSVRVGEGDRGSVETALDGTGIDRYELFATDDIVAVFAYADADRLADALVDATFADIEIPDAEGSPEEHLAELRQRRRELVSNLETVENEIEDVRVEVGGFLLAIEEELTIEVEKREAPLSFATTENAFVAEGWIPTDWVAEFERALDEAVGDHVEFAELERADYDEDGHAVDREEVVDRGQEPGQPAAADGGTEDDVAADGGTVTTVADEPPVVQKNPGPVKPFEALTEVINRPKYSEFDPTVVLFLTFPAFFGFMIGDVGYGALYLALGYWLWTSFDSDVIRSLGGVAMWAGGFTVLFGVLYGEIFGLHLVSTFLWEGALGLKSSPLHKGLQPVHAEFALGWLVLSLIAGMVHLAVGWIFDFVENLEHGLGDAVTESGSWLLMLAGLWVWIFGGASGSAPDLLYGPESVFNGHPFPLDFTGFAPELGLVGLAVFAVGLVLLLIGEPLEGVEFLNVLVNVLSYTRLAAVLLAKAGMAFVVNLLFFGVYVTDDGAWHFGLGGMKAVGDVYHGTHEVTEVMFGGLVHSGIAGVLVGLVVLVVGHLLVLALGVTSAGLQAIRLEYVEFFGKFYEGGGRPYTPFGHERSYTRD